MVYRTPWIVGCILLLFGGSAWADDDKSTKKIVAAIEKVLSEGEVDKALDLLDDPSFEPVARSVRDTWNVASAVRECVEDHAEGAFEREPFVRLVDRTLALTAPHIEKNPKDRYAGFGRCHALRARGWLRFYEGEADFSRDWEGAFSLLIGIATHDPWNGRTTEIACGYLNEAARLEGAPAEALLERAYATAKADHDAHPNHARTQSSYGLSRYEQAARALAAKKKADAKKLMVEALAALRSAAEAKSDAKNRFFRNYHTVARYAHSKKLVKSPEVISRTQKSRYGYHSFEVPRGDHWSRSNATGKAQRLTTLKRSDGAGIVQIKFHRYWWSSNYSVGDSSMGGDNLKGLMEQDRKVDVEWLGKVTRQRKLVKGALSKHIKKTTGFEIRGITRGGSNYWTQVWYFKSEFKPATFSVTITFQGNGEVGRDLEIDHLLRSMKELKVDD